MLAGILAETYISFPETHIRAADPPLLILQLENFSCQFLPVKLPYAGLPLRVGPSLTLTLTSRYPHLYSHLHIVYPPPDLRLQTTYIHEYTFCNKISNQRFFSFFIFVIIFLNIVLSTEITLYHYNITCIRYSYL